MLFKTKIMYYVNFRNSQWESLSRWGSSSKKVSLSEEADFYSISTRGILVMVGTIFRIDSFHNSFVSTELYKKYSISTICVSFACVVEGRTKHMSSWFIHGRYEMFKRCKSKAITLRVLASADQITEML